MCGQCPNRAALPLALFNRSPPSDKRGWYSLAAGNIAPSNQEHDMDLTTTRQESARDAGLVLGTLLLVIALAVGAFWASATVIPLWPESHAAAVAARISRGLGWVVSLLWVQLAGASIDEGAPAVANVALHAVMSWLVFVVLLPAGLVGTLGLI